MMVFGSFEIFCRGVRVPQHRFRSYCGGRCDLKSCDAPASGADHRYGRDYVRAVALLLGAIIADEMETANAGPPSEERSEQAALGAIHHIIAICPEMI